MARSRSDTVFCFSEYNIYHKSLNKRPARLFQILEKTEVLIRGYAYSIVPKSWLETSTARNVNNNISGFLTYSIVQK